MSGQEFSQCPFSKALLSVPLSHPSPPPTTAASGLCGWRCRRREGEREVKRRSLSLSLQPPTSPVHLVFPALLQILLPFKTIVLRSVLDGLREMEGGKKGANLRR